VFIVQISSEFSYRKFFFLNSEILLTLSICFVTEIIHWVLHNLTRFCL